MSFVVRIVLESYMGKLKGIWIIPVDQIRTHLAVGCPKGLQKKSQEKDSHGGGDRVMMSEKLRDVRRGFVSILE